VVEVPCHVDAAGAVALSTEAPDAHQLGLMSQVKAVEQLTIVAARSRDVALATKAFALHPLVDSVTVARELVRGYGIEALFREPLRDC
jgi:6-phospho-beta-glucosidase